MKFVLTYNLSLVWLDVILEKWDPVLGPPRPLGPLGLLDLQDPMDPQDPHNLWTSKPQDLRTLGKSPLPFEIQDFRIQKL